MKFKSNVDGVRDEIASQRNVDTATIWETLDVQPRKLVKLKWSTYELGCVYMYNWQEEGF